MNIAAEAPFLIALNLTRRCNLNCKHCYMDAGAREEGGPGELGTGEAIGLIDEIADISDETMIVLTGGEPLLRKDIEQLASHAAGRGLMCVLGTNGLGLTPSRVQSLVKSGVSAAGISVDSLKPEHHDEFRGLPGSWEKTMAGIDACKAGGMMFQLHFSVTEENAHEIDDMIDFCRSSGASVLNIFFLVCTGRGERFTNITSATYERVLARVAEAARDEKSLIVRARCAPHFKRMAMEMEPPLEVTEADGYEAGGCHAGRRYARIMPDGGVTACPYIEQPVGNIRDSSFARLWNDAPMFLALRKPELEGRCGECEYSRLCGGCRARPFARDGNLMGEDFLCDYQPGGSALIEPMPQTKSGMAWSVEAEQRLAHVPAFVRRFVRRRAENHARELGAEQVMAVHLDELARRRFGGPPPFLRKPDDSGGGS